jgi:hypothetical protein
MLRVASPLGKRLVGKTMGFEFSAFRQFWIVNRAGSRNCLENRLSPKGDGFRLLGYPPLSMSHGPRSYLRIRKGLQGKDVGHGHWFNGFVKPSTKQEKRRAAKRVRRIENVPDGKAFRRAWGHWEWC